MQEDRTGNDTGSEREDGAPALTGAGRTGSPASGGDDIPTRAGEAGDGAEGDAGGGAGVAEMPLHSGSPRPGGGAESEKAAHDRIIANMRDCKVALDIFEGPLDLLLYLIRRDEVDICDIPIMKITDQYLQYLDLMRMLDLDIASEFLVMAATLLHIKSRMLLPPEERPVEEQVDEDEDPRMELVKQLLEYKRFKETAVYLSEKELGQQAVFARYIDRTFLPEPTDSPLTEVSIFDLISAFSDVLKRVTGEPREITEEIYTVTDKIAAIMDLLKMRSVLKFSELFKDAIIRAEVVVTFLALLELIRLKKIQTHQPSPFAEIEICAA
ncbi:MAG: segregation/condensation protein A [Candidatus Aureabacteria bacterium]|nr:segregation/condensation protein A [Candidatus Auribacterota bacterium]